MTSATEPIHFELRPPRRPRPHWRVAIHALRELIRDSERTELAFQVQRALDPDQHERALRRMLAHPEGRRLFQERPRLLDSLSDRTALAALPEGSFGRAYLAHLERYGLDPGKLVALGQSYNAGPEQRDSDVAWMAQRSALAHDLWHVLTGYGADGAGESALLLFSLAQTGGRSNALLSAGANLELTRVRGLSWAAYAWCAWRRGRRAVCLAALPYEALLGRPLDVVRSAAGIEPPEVAHPGGIVEAHH